LLLCALATLVWQRRQQRQLERSLLATREPGRAPGARRGVAPEPVRHRPEHRGILWVNWDSHVRYANHAAERMLGYAEGACWSGR
jgi:PAS domain-containing protein